MRPLRSSTAVACALACACANAPEPFAPSPMGLRITHALLDSVESRDSSPQRVRVALFAVRSPLSGPSLDAAVVALTAGRGAPFRGASGLPAGTVWLAGDAAAVAAADLARAADRAHLLATADAFPAPDLSASARPDEVRLPCIDLQVGADGGIHVRVGAERTADGSPVLAAHLAAPLPAEGPVVLFVPAGNAPIAGHAFVLARMADDASTAAAAAQARASAASPAPPQIGWPRRWRIAFQSVGQHNRRPPLLEIARTLGASRCRDALLVADEALLIAFTERLAVELTPADAYAPWPFERVLWRALLPRLERDELPDALHAHCLRQLGAMADDTAALRSALDASADGEAFARALREDNVGALADHDAAWRARGLDWLRRQGVQVPGYDPLGGDDERRIALRAFFAAEAAAEGGR